MKDLQIVHERSDFLDWLVSNLLDKFYFYSVSPAASLAETSRSAHRILDLRSKAAFQSKSFVYLSLRLGIKRLGYWLAASWRRYFSRVIFSFKTAWNFIRSQSNPVEWISFWHYPCPPWAGSWLLFLCSLSLYSRPAFNALKPANTPFQTYSLRFYLSLM